MVHNGIRYDRILEYVAWYNENGIRILREGVLLEHSVWSGGGIYSEDYQASHQERSVLITEKTMPPPVTAKAQPFFDAGYKKGE